MYIEERHRALGRDATFSWSRALTHPPRCNRTRHRGRHLDFVGAAILDRKSWGPPSWTGSDVKNAKVTPILLVYTASPEPLLLTENLPDSNFDIFELRKLKAVIQSCQIIHCSQERKKSGKYVLIRYFKATKAPSSFENAQTRLSFHCSHLGL